MNDQHGSLDDKINNKKLQSLLYRTRLYEHVHLKDSSTWMIAENNNLRDEELYCYIQDRNVLWEKLIFYADIVAKIKKLFYLTRRCKRILGHDYTEGITNF
ncbi:hypothetical protein TCON_1487 [Astathelohania contejeani]|uniref:Uncharacterized protein n=1 Tax=Astathelohania contejeani TaxID=164912 RepID=A0ABQ7HYR0_9MICR|nr:hypothetical protein TCON_1487 [Thelohania contejeani]